MTMRRNKRIPWRLFAALGMGLFLSARLIFGQAFDIKTHYTKTEYMVPMRDGIKLYTQIYATKDKSLIMEFPFWACCKSFTIFLNIHPLTCLNKVITPKTTRSMTQKSTQIPLDLQTISSSTGVGSCICRLSLPLSWFGP
jgi:predicted acyl esterase